MLPASYQVIGDSAVFQTNAASILVHLAEPTRVTFQVDKVDHATAVGWSVSVRGTSGVRDAGDVASFPPQDPIVGVAVRIEEVTSRMISGSPIPRS